MSYSGRPWSIDEAVGLLTNSSQADSAATPYIDYGFISRSEGGQKPGLYAPPSSHSGVTVATGIDLSRHTADELRDWGVPDDAIQKLSPYLAPASGVYGLTGDTARKALRDANGGPALDQSVLDALDRGALGGTIASIRRQFDGGGSGTRFDDLPVEARTAIIDLYHQYGANVGRTPDFWNAIRSGSWNHAVDILNDFGDAFPSRRKREAALIGGALDRGILDGGS